MPILDTGTGSLIGVTYTPITTYDTIDPRIAEVLLSVPTASSINSQSSLFDIQKNTVADGVIPIIYGQAQVGAQPFAIDYSSANRRWTVGYVVCLGEIDSYVSVLLNGETKTAGTTITYYTGTTTQTTDSTLSGAIAGYTDDLVIDDPTHGDIGIAYIVIQYDDDDYSTWPDVLVEVKGRKVFDPSSSPETVYTENPALHLADLISNAQYGQGITVDSTDLATAASYCDELVGSPNEVRRKSYLVLGRAQKTEAWIEVLRTYASCFVVYRGDTAHIIPDKTASSVMTLTASDVVEGSIRIQKKDSSDIPTVIRAYYTDTTGDEWRERLCDPAKAAGVDLGTTPWRESRIRLTGVNRHSQAYRECVERLNKLTLSDLEVRWTMHDEALALELGDVVTLSHPYGLTNKLLRIIEDPREVSPGRWEIAAAEYDPAAYSSEIVSDPTYVDAVLPAEGAYPPGITTYYTGTEPTSPSPGDVWYDSGTDNVPKRRDDTNTGWDNVHDTTNDFTVTGIQTESFTAVVNGVYPIDAASASPLADIVMTLPASPSQNDRVYFMEYNGSWGASQVSVRGGGSPQTPIMGLSEDMICDQSNFNGSLVYIDATTGWVIGS